VDKILLYTLRVDRLLFQKFRYIAYCRLGRALRQPQNRAYMKRAVQEYEKQHGFIEVENK